MKTNDVRKLQVVEPGRVASSRLSGNSGASFAQNTPANTTTTTATKGSLALAVSARPVSASAAESDPLRGSIRDWLTAGRANGLSPRTLTDYQDKIFKFWWWWHDCTRNAETVGAGPDAVAVKHARDFVTYLRTPVRARWGITDPTRRLPDGLSPASIAAYGRTVKAFFNWLVAEDVLKVSPFNKGVKFTSHRDDNRVVEAVAETDLEKIFMYLNSPSRLQTYEGKRDRAILAFLLDSGVRRGELLGLRLDDIDYTKGRARVIGKTGERVVFVSAPCLEALKLYREARRSLADPALWLSKDGVPMSYDGFSGLIARIRDGSGVEFHAHQLRHTYASMLAARGVPLSALQHLLGHENPSTTNIYVHRNAERLAETYAPVSPIVSLPNISSGMKRQPGRPRKDWR